MLNKELVDVVMSHADKVWRKLQSVERALASAQLEHDALRRATLMLIKSVGARELTKCRISLVLLAVQNKLQISDEQQALAHFTHLCASFPQFPAAPLFSKERHMQDLHPFCRRMIVFFLATGDKRLADPYSSL